MTGAACGPACPASRPGGVAAGDLSAFESVFHFSAFSPLSVKAPPRMPGGCNRPRRLPSLFTLLAACTFAALRGVRRGWRAACLAVYRARQPLACGCGWGELPVGTPVADTPVVGNGCAGAVSGSATGTGGSLQAAGSGRFASPLRTNGSLRGSI
jgi:hypothetical protein